MNRRPFSLLLLQAFLALWWWALILVGIAIVVWIGSRSSDSLELALLGYASDIDASTLAAEDRDGKQLQVQFDGPARVRLTLPPGHIAVGGGHKAILLGFLTPLILVCVYFVKQLRDIVRTIDQQDPFIDENATRVRVIGGLILLFALFKSFGQLVVTSVADSIVVPRGFNLDGRLHFDLGLVVVGVAVIVLSEVFRHGTRLRDDQSLTV